MTVVLKDSLDRPLRNLRLSVTDRCNLRCSYCMPEPEYVWLPREDILHFEEIETLVDVFTTLGVDKVRLTGGEPLLRRNLPGRVGEYEHTNCHTCGTRLISRYGYLIQEYALTPDGACPACHTAVPGRWSAAFEGQRTAHPFLPHDRTRLSIL